MGRVCVRAFIGVSVCACLRASVLYRVLKKINQLTLHATICSKEE
jgi:hypothetical protein